MTEETFSTQEQGPEEELGKTGADESAASTKAGPAGSYLDMFEPVPADELAEEEKIDEDWESMIRNITEKADELREGKIVRGTVYAVNEKEVILDVGFKSEGTIPFNEFETCEEVKPGDVFDVFLEKMENQDGLIVLSKEKADFLKAWDTIKEAYDQMTVVTTKVDRRIKGGLVVKLLGVDAFLPGSQIALRQVPNLDELIGEELEAKIIKLNKRRRNIVVSRRVVLEEEREKKKKKLLAELQVGETREGIVKNITDFGAFVDLGGIDGLLHLTDLTWGRVSHPSEVVAIGDKLSVKILDFDLERERISLGLKQLTPYPWEGVDERYPVGNKIRGKVVSITDYGAFIELEKGVEGLIHISEMSWTRHVKHPSKIVAIGDTVEAVVLNVDQEHEKISLGLKQLEPDPWKQLEGKYPPGTRLKGKVRNLTNFGAFVEIEDGIDGLVHISDMSWAKRIRHPSEMVRKGDDIEVVVLDIDSAKRRISLGMKQTRENPWSALAREYGIGTEVEGTISRILDRGCVVELRDDVEGFVPLSHLGIDNLRKPTEHFEPGAKLPLRVIKMDPQNKRIVLSVNAWLEARGPEEAAAFIERFPKRELPPEDETEPVDQDDDVDYDDAVDEVAADTEPDGDVTGPAADAEPDGDVAGPAADAEPDGDGEEPATGDAGDDSPEPEAEETSEAGEPAAEEEAPGADEDEPGKTS